jgi:hypothetical protein
LDPFGREGVYADFLSFFIESLKGDNAINLREKGEIFPHPYIDTRMDTGTVLPNQDRSGMNFLSAETFHS